MRPCFDSWGGKLARADRSEALLNYVREIEACIITWSKWRQVLREQDDFGGTMRETLDATEELFVVEDRLEDIAKAITAAIGR